MQRRSLKFIGAVLLLGISFFSQQGWGDEAVVQAPSGSSIARLKVTRDQTTLPIVLDFAKILTFDQPARTIIIGNPGIVDGTLSDETTIVLTGKAVGATNMIVLGESGREIANLRVNVSTSLRQMTTVDHGGVQQTYSCIDTCRSIGKAASAK
ncbi:pilus assembly protein N-terminal domain-containing protein [Microvirga sp. KLBC 81]|uniref:pilus assembly protein N-terminal domain-containing protein n=1 Tax=Microvirga sp. KLBC 81 TaxID=1862707 RepID=UPI0014040F13|nr:pilus assembly protein N-terminal domain-containing protein [Microvirga sp. KLBC 81]